MIQCVIKHDTHVRDKMKKKYVYITPQSLAFLKYKVFMTAKQ